MKLVTRYAVLLVGCLCWIMPTTARAGAAFFGSVSDTIEISGQTVIGTSCTYEVMIMFPTCSNANGVVFMEHQVFAEDKQFQAGPSFFRGFNFAASCCLEFTTNIAFDVFHHVAFVYDGNEERFYIDGSVAASRVVGSVDASDSDALGHIGAFLRSDAGVQVSFIGLLDSVRLSTVARYTGNSFTPPTGDLTSDAETVLLYNFNDAPGSTNVVDESPLNRTGTLGVGFGGATSPQLVANGFNPCRKFLGPCPYLSFADSPFHGAECTYFHLEDFEDSLLNVPGVTASAGAPTGPGGFTDSVDGDDGAIDGSGTSGHSFFSSPGSDGVTFTFSTNALGALPTFAGIVWTDGAGDTSFEAFDQNGTSLGTNGPVTIADGSIVGETAEDRFFGVVSAAGISAIKISNTSGGIEIDHLQYGFCAGNASDGCPSNAAVAVACTLDPSVATSVIGDTHLVTVTVTTNGAPASGAAVDFAVLTGPNAGTTASGNTDNSGKTTFNYDGNGPAGTDTIQTIATVDGTSSTCTATKVWVEAPSKVHDLALVKIKAPKNINLQGAESSLTKFVKVTLQNRSPHNEVITNFTGLVTLVAQSLSNVCADAQVVLHAGPPNNPKTLKPKQKMTVTFDVTWTCANDPLKGVGHEDFRYLASVHHEAIDGNADTHPEDDGCPRAALPGSTDPNPDPDKPLKDTGCAGGVDVKTDVFLKQ
jgi:hypothetical protein